MNKLRKLINLINFYLSFPEKFNKLIKIEDNTNKIKSNDISSILDVYVKSNNFPQSSFDIFLETWSSSVPGYKTGNAGLFDDIRIKYFNDKLNTFKNKNVLELGPLEGGHTYMMSKLGASSIDSVESNTHAFLKCLITQNALKYTANFILADCIRFLKENKKKYDFILCSGILYHMLDPLNLLSLISKATDRVGFWTHYYDFKIMNSRDDLKKKFNHIPLTKNFNGFEVFLFEQNYFEALNWEGFCGGSNLQSYWLSRESLIRSIESLGFKIDIDNDDTLHPNGPCLTFFAYR
jgi:hypothetical protein